MRRGAVDVDAAENQIHRHAKHQRAFFYNRAAPDVITAGERLNEPVAKARAAMAREISRPARECAAAVLRNGKLTVTEVRHSFRGLQLNDLRAFQRDIILQFTGIPPAIMGALTTSTGGRSGRGLRLRAPRARDAAQVGRAGSLVAQLARPACT